jgi:hypothetical protein
MNSLTGKDANREQGIGNRGYFRSPMNSLPGKDCLFARVFRTTVVAEGGAILNYEYEF